MMGDRTNILIAGVGGQGSLLASKLLGQLFLRRGLDVKVNEVHGMSQRGGSVVTTVRAGAQVHSPLVTQGECDLLIALEQLEALRWVGYLKPGAGLIASTQAITPMSVVAGKSAYPNAVEALSAVKPDTLWVDALALAERAGNLRAANVALLGASARFLPFSPEEWQAAIQACVPSRALAVNIEAFRLGSEQ